MHARLRVLYAPPAPAAATRQRVPLDVAALHTFVLVVGSLVAGLVVIDLFIRSPVAAAVLVSVALGVREYVRATVRRRS